MATSRISGTVVDTAGRPLAGVPVFVESAPVAMPDIAVLTDEGGGFVVPAPATGSYVVGCTGERGERMSARVEVDVDREPEVAVRLALPLP